MYSPLIVDQKLWKLQKQGIAFKRRSVNDSRAITRKLDKLVVDGKRTRQYSPEELSFIRSETAICRADFRYWAERYGYLEQDASEGGGVAPATFWPSQERALELIAKREEDNYREFEKHNFSPGIRVVWHKTRQQGATGIARLICGHRMTLNPHTRAIAASLDETKVQELYKRDHIWLDNLPDWLKPTIQFDVKNSHLAFGNLKSTLTYQQANQQAGVGTGQQFDVSHMTEISLWQMAERLQFDFLPAVPQSLNTFVGFESTANGRHDFWHDFTENVRRKERGFEVWVYVFTPHYINQNKNRLPAPDGWTPEPITVEHAQLIERTSYEFAGVKVIPDRDHLYWWETEYMLNRRLGTLHIFLTNYPATPEQSFQHSTRSALPIDTIEWMRTGAKLGMPYLPEVRNQRA